MKKMHNIRQEERLKQITTLKGEDKKNNSTNKRKD